MKYLGSAVLSALLLSQSALAEDTKLFVAKLTYQDGALDNPVFVFSHRIEAATSAVFDAVSGIEVKEIVVSEWPDDAIAPLGLGEEDQDGSVLVHRGYSWTAGLALRPTFPGDISSSGEASIGQGISDGLIFHGYLMDPGPDVRPGETWKDTHERRQLEDLKSLPNGGRGAGHGGGPG